MKDDTITKLYSGLTDKERAALAFDYLMQGNDVERKRIESAMPEQHFVGLPQEYRSAFYSVQMLAMLYAIEYWRQVAMVNIYLAGTCAMSGKALAAAESLQSDEALSQTTEYQNWKAITESFERQESMLPSLDAALDDVCAEHGINPAAIRMMAGRQFYTVAQPDLKPDADLVAVLRENFSGLLE